MICKPPPDPSTQSDFDRDSTTGSGTLTAWRKARRIAVAVVGGTLLFLGVLLLILPGPAFIVIPAALAVLGIEFRWARRWLRKARSVLPNTAGRNAGQGPQSPSPG